MVFSDGLGNWSANQSETDKTDSFHSGFCILSGNIIRNCENTEQLHDFIIYYFKGYDLKSQFIRHFYT